MTNDETPLPDLTIDDVLRLVSAARNYQRQLRVSRRVGHLIETTISDYAVKNPRSQPIRPNELVVVDEGCEVNVIHVDGKWTFLQPTSVVHLGSSAGLANQLNAPDGDRELAVKLAGLSRFADSVNAATAAADSNEVGP